MSVREGRRLARSVAVGPHVLLADEPEPISADTGPTPGELLLAALGSCTSMAVRAYAGRHGWQLHQVDVDLDFDPRGQIVKNVRLVGDLEPAHIERLLTVAGRCPVQRLLTGDVSVVTVPTVVTPYRRPPGGTPQSERGTPRCGKHPNG
ncbi:OsmC family protein [Streptomyces sp. FIT100]|uniref:OsmC family protein n=1 Tax=Streptomyces sp. FIT100 TaxID=2837956 RepID=UPI0021C798EB|nr:OsmC family protein [Streptomyces sp. FIT100]